MSAIIFGISHIVPPQIVAATLLAILMTLLFLASRSLWPVIACHVMNNALGVGLGLAAAAGRLPGWLTPPVH